MQQASTWVGNPPLGPGRYTEQNKPPVWPIGRSGQEGSTPYRPPSLAVTAYRSTKNSRWPHLVHS